MKICFYTKHEIDWGSSRNRVGIYLKYFLANKYEYTTFYAIPNKLSQIWIGKSEKPWIYRKILSFWHSRILRHLKLLWIIFNSKHYDLIFIQKVNLSYPLLALLKMRNENIIYDFDDLCFWPAELLKNEVKIGIPKRLGLWWKKIQHPRVLSLFSHIIAGNKNLAEIASFVLEDKKISIIPTSVDCDFYLPKREEESSLPIVIGWSGTGENHLSHLKLLLKPFDLLASKHKFVFKLIGAMHSAKIKNLFESKKYKFVCINWVEQEKLPEQIRTFDIGVMPLVENSESRSKCGFKALEYMASSVPVIASPVGVNREIIKDSENGYCAKNESEWVEKLILLINSESLRKKFAHEGRKTVENCYSVQKNLLRYKEIFEKITDKKGNEI